MPFEIYLNNRKMETKLTEEEEKRIAASMWATATKKELLEKVSELTISTMRQNIRIELLKEALRQTDPYLAVFELFADPAVREKMAKFRERIAKLVERAD